MERKDDGKKIRKKDMKVENLEIEENENYKGIRGRIIEDEGKDDRGKMKKDERKKLEKEKGRIGISKIEGLGIERDEIGEKKRKGLKSEIIEKSFKKDIIE